VSLPDFQVLRPRTVAEAVELLGKYAGEVQVIAGGTDLIPSLRQRLFAPKYVLDIGRVSELRGIRPERNYLVIGAGTSLNAIEHSDVIRRDYPVLALAAAAVASPLLRNMGTLGGNICLNTRCIWYNQSLTWRKTCNFCIKKDGDLCHVAPSSSKCWSALSADTPPALLCLGAELEIVGPGGARCIAIRDFYTNLGDAPMNLGKDELLTRISLPVASAGYHGTYRKLRVRGSIDYPLAGLALALKYADGSVADARLAITAVNPAPLLVRGAEELLTGKPLSEDLASAAGELAARTAKPLSTSALTPEYRREMVRVLTKRALLDEASAQ